MSTVEAKDANLENFCICQNSKDSNETFLSAPCHTTRISSHHVTSSVIGGHSPPMGPGRPPAVGWPSYRGPGCSPEVCWAWSGFCCVFSGTELRPCDGRCVSPLRMVHTGPALFSGPACPLRGWQALSRKAPPQTPVLSRPGAAPSGP